MPRKIPARTLRERPDLEQLKRQAKELLAAFVAGEADAIAEVNAHYRDADPATFALHDAQLALARSYAFDSWPKLKAHVDGVTVARFIEAVRAGDAAQARTMLSARPDLVNMQVSYGDERCALHYAVMERSPAMARLLMQQGAESRKGVHPHRAATSPLTMATERGYHEIVSIIEEEEQNRRKAMSGATAVTSAQDELGQALRRGDETRALAMLEADPTLVHACDRDGWTALHVAAAVLSERAVAWLVTHGADVNRHLTRGRTPLDLASVGRGARNGPSAGPFAAVAGTLQAHGATLTPIAAVALGDAGWLRARHAEGVLVNSIDWSTGGLLTVAAKHDRPEILAWLLDIGFDPDERVRWGEGPDAAFSQAYPLWHCAAHGKRAMAELLLQRGANPNAHVDSSGSPVFAAYSYRQWATVDLLKRYGGVVSADIVGIYRDTELARQLLADSRERAVAETMVEPGKSLEQDLLEFAASGGGAEIVRMALERIDWPRDDPRWFRMLGRTLDFWNHIPWLSGAHPELDRASYLTCCRLVLERCDPNLVGGFGRTILHEVAAVGDHVTADEAAAVASMLLDAGARLDVRDELLASTPLGWACRWGRPEVVRLLLARGADPVEADAEPWATPRAWAERMGHRAVLALLPSRDHG